MLDLLVLSIPMSGVFIFILVLYIMSNSKMGDVEKRKKIVKSDASLKVFVKNLEQAEYAYVNSEYSKAANLYVDIIDNCPNLASLDEYNIYLDCAISLFKTGKIELSYKYFILAISKNRESFEASHYLGIIEYKKGNFERALNRFSLAIQLNPEDRNNQKYIGLTLANMKKWIEASKYLKQISKVTNDPEVIYYYALCNEYLDRKETALNLLNQIKADLNYGSLACLHAGIINILYKKYYEAKDDLLAGLTYHKIDENTIIELKYRLAVVSIYLRDFKSVVHYLKDVYNHNPSYKDVDILLTKYSDIIKDENLYQYLSSNDASFLSITRKITKSFYPKGVFSFVDSRVTDKFVEYRTMLDAEKWGESAIFRFFIGTIPISNDLIDTMFEKMRNERIDKGYCISASNFPDDLKNHYLSRPIEFIESEKLSKIISDLNQQ